MYLEGCITTVQYLPIYSYLMLIILTSTNTWKNSFQAWPFILMKIFFLFLSEEDQGNEMSVQCQFIWVIIEVMVRQNERRSFFNAQVQCAASLDHELILFDGMLYQINNIFSPKVWRMLFDGLFCTGTLLLSIRLVILYFFKNQNIK
jgi:hypothetical protein